MTVKVGLLSGGQRQALTLLMATLQRPRLLLLDEHTAALDPATAEKVLEITDKVVGENKLTTLMVTHNMTEAIRHGNRLLMMNAGRIILDISGEEKKNLTKEYLLKKFAETAGVQEETDSVLLS
jgi:putative ABC transport system ATP-binding protein